MASKPCGSNESRALHPQHPHRPKRTARGGPCACRRRPRAPATRFGHDQVRRSGVVPTNRPSDRLVVVSGDSQRDNRPVRLQSSPRIAEEAVCRPHRFRNQKPCLRSPFQLLAARCIVRATGFGFRYEASGATSPRSRRRSSGRLSSGIWWTITAIRWPRWTRNAARCTGTRAHALISLSGRRRPQRQRNKRRSLSSSARPRASISISRIIIRAKATRGRSAASSSSQTTRASLPFSSWCRGYPAISFRLTRLRGRPTGRRQADRRDQKQAPGIQPQGVSGPALQVSFDPARRPQDGARPGIRHDLENPVR